MRRILIVVGIILLVIAAFLYIEHSSVKRNEANRQMFDVVMSEKMNELYSQAQDWSKPVQLNVHDDRLNGDYKILSEFLLNYWMSNVETRNQYLRELKAAKWDQFLDVNRLDADRKNGYKETENMLKVAHKVTEQYQKQNLQNKKEALAKAKSLPIDRDIRDPLQAKLEQNLKVDQENSLILLELQILTKADAMFEMLKSYKWQKQGDKILFAQDAQVKQFNALYQDILRLNLEIEQKKKQNTLAVQQQ
ncbi:hypothetical protein [Acinetobacter sp. ANC 4648]|uniref:hypothetical protein n=1 Tax=Acinetobacter sp. ANC 4648 TaxID=1977875 RepID=UPI000A338356|nr:hypothetical protein [Acinetobacter sp. ANC 4648]OTG80733.1 hypothetical protein B9T27_12775 [Acinetobacter sp. ANC 4648]